MIAILNPISIIILAKLIIAHLLTDYVFQPNSWVKDKKANTYKSVKLYLHVFIAGLTTYLLLSIWSNWWAPGLIIIFHYLIDLIKLNFENGRLRTSEQNNDKKNKLLWLFLIDQFAHLLVIIGIWILLITDREILWQNILQLLNRQDLWIIVLAYLVISNPSAKLISIFTTRWNKPFTYKNEQSDNEGMYIGIFERFLILTFILLNQYQAIGFLIAAKSILRFRKEGNDEPQKQTEYVLIGTLISLIIALSIGIITKHLIKFCG